MERDDSEGSREGQIKQTFQICVSQELISPPHSNTRAPPSLATGRRQLSGEACVDLYLDLDKISILSLVGSRL